MKEILAVLGLGLALAVAGCGGQEEASRSSMIQGTPTELGPTFDEYRLMIQSNIAALEGVVKRASDRESKRVRELESLISLAKSFLAKADLLESRERSGFLRESSREVYEVLARALNGGLARTAAFELLREIEKSLSTRVTKTRTDVGATDECPRGCAIQ